MLGIRKIIITVLRPSMMSQSYQRWDNFLSLCVCLVKHTLIDKCLELWIVEIVASKFRFLAQKLDNDLEQSVVRFYLGILFVAPANGVREVFVGSEAFRQLADLLDGFFRVLSFNAPEGGVELFQNIRELIEVGVGGRAAATDRNWVDAGIFISIWNCASACLIERYWSKSIESSKPSVQSSRGMRGSLAARRCRYIYIFSQYLEL